MVKKEVKAQRERNDGGEAGRGRAWSEGGVKKDRGTGSGRHEGGEAGRGRAWSAGGSE